MALALPLRAFGGGSCPSRLSESRTFLPARLTGQYLRANPTIQFEAQLWTAEAVALSRRESPGKVVGRRGEHPQPL